MFNLFLSGLLIKQLLVTASKEPSLQGMVEKSNGIVFYGVPHKGSPLSAKSNQAKFLVYPSVEVQELKQGNTRVIHGVSSCEKKTCFSQISKNYFSP